MERSSHSKAIAVSAAISMCAAVLASCASSPGITSSDYAIGDQDASHRTYRLGMGDKLKITVFGEENLSGEFEVNAFGRVSVPLIGEVPAAGRPIVEFRNDVSARLANGYLRNPRVNVDVLNYRPIYVQGEVKSGGEFAYKSGLRLRDAIALAGGYTYRADQSYVDILREGKGELRASTSSRLTLLPGDNIRVPERFF
ncbi:MAG: polysaccharide export protein [Hyphomicrobiaceae bacterium]|nr:polysaccharide export protein [Hyphomicrobiaceae bacterium]MCC0011045.1 polysaccharide export protein [Hyphomicrobiaceae bacterium]